MSSVAIAGRVVQQGDTLYHMGLQSWGQVIGTDTGSVILRLSSPQGERIFHVTDGGRIAGVRQVYWHEPLALDVPFQNIGKYQRIINAIRAEGL